MNTIERVIHHLRRHPNLVFCDECLEKELRVRGSLTRMLDVLNREYFHRTVAKCHLCGQDKMSIEQFRQVDVPRRKRAVLPKIRRAFDVEMIRDGGSFAAYFEDEGGRRYVLFTKIMIADHDELTKERIGYASPILIECDPAERPPNTARYVHSELSGPATPVTWARARTLMALTKGFAEGLDEWRAKWLKCMNYIVASDGDVPATMDRIMRMKRPSSSLRKS